MRKDATTGLKILYSIDNIPLGHTFTSFKSNKEHSSLIADELENATFCLQIFSVMGKHFHQVSM